jgi:hypothetical protein
VAIPGILVIRTGWYGIIGITIPIVLLKNFSYIRDWLVADNPLYPYRLTVGLFSFPGVIDWYAADDEYCRNSLQYLWEIYTNKTFCFNIGVSQ